MQASRTASAKDSSSVSPKAPGAKTDAVAGKAQPDAVAQGNPPPPDSPTGATEKKTKISPWIPIVGISVGVLAATYLVVSLSDGSSGHDPAPRPVEVTVVTPYQGSP